MHAYFGQQKAQCAHFVRMFHLSSW